jgi:hypothetical protein
MNTVQQSEQQYLVAITARDRALGIMSRIRDDIAGDDVKAASGLGASPEWRRSQQRSYAHHAALHQRATSDAATIRRRLKQARRDQSLRGDVGSGTSSAYAAAFLKVATETLSTSTLRQLHEAAEQAIAAAAQAPDINEVLKPFRKPSISEPVGPCRGVEPRRSIPEAPSPAQAAYELELASGARA